MFFESDSFHPESLANIYPQPAFTLYTPADTAVFGKMQESLKNISSWHEPIEAIACSPITGEMQYVSYLGERYRVYDFLDGEVENLFEQVMGCLPDYQVRLVASDEGRHNLLVEASDDRTPSSWYNYDCDSMRISLIHAPSQLQLRRYLSPVIPITFNARDNTILRGYLTLPHGVKADDAPHLHAMVIPHAFGYPADRWEYNPEVQFLANRGLAVLQVEYRDASADSTVSADEAQQQAIHDVRDGAAWLAHSGIANPRKIFYHVHDTLPYGAADRMFRDPAIAKAIDPRQHMAFYNDMVHKATR